MSLPSSFTRRDFVNGAALLAGAAALPSFLHAQARDSQNPPLPSSGAPLPVWEKPALPPGEPYRDYRPTITLNGSTLPFKIAEGVKIFHLVCEEVDHIFVPQTEWNQECRAYCWGFNKQVHGPTIECVEGDRVRIYVTNNLPEPTSIHWHGLIVPSGMDGVGGLNQPPIEPGQTFKYEFTVWQHGTFMYHSHHDEMTQMQLGLIGMFIAHPRTPSSSPPDRDYVFLLSEWKIVPGTRRPDPNEMTEFNLLTLNARAFPGTAPMLAKTGERVRIRLGNLSATDHHPMHIHGHTFKLTETGGGSLPMNAQTDFVTILVPVGSTRTVELVANNPGDWAFHCHMFHHIMNQMGHALPTVIGMKPGPMDQRIRKFLPGYMTMGQNGMAHMAEMHMKVPPNSVPMVGAPGPNGYITMGGMFTTLKIRNDLGKSDPAKGEDFSYAGWYAPPIGTQATLASAEELKKDLGIS
ncbi:MAG: copper oxidase [Verrucomicrobia bacterium]|nr:MAG: copper oxidase [Verrucomicrobiota bacterium]